MAAPDATPVPRSHSLTQPLLGPHAEFEGLLVLHGEARIDGTVRGQVLGAEVLYIGESGCVEARIEAAEVVISGRLEGDVVASRRVELRPTARVRGSLVSPRIALAEGCTFDGPCCTRDARGAKEKPATA